MAGQTIGTVNVQVGPSVNPRVNQITYGGRTLKSATDVDLVGAQQDDVLVYQANTQTFVTKNAGDITSDVDAGFF